MTQTTPNPSEDMDFASMLEASFSTEQPQEIKDGGIVNGTVVDIISDYAIVDVGLKSEGRVHLREFEDEETISYELGVKSTLLDSRLRLNAAAFFTEIDDYQFQQQVEAGIGTIVSNRAAVEVSGIDMEIQALPPDGRPVQRPGTGYR